MVWMNESHGYERPKNASSLLKNVENRLPELAQAARRRVVELRAKRHGATNAAEEEALQAVYAYERVLCRQRGKIVRASRTWQMIERHGIIPAVERAVNRKEVTSGYKALVEMGMPDFAFEAVVCRHPTLFSAESLKRSQERMKEWKNVAEA
jgi:hypothetical protein